MKKYIVFCLLLLSIGFIQAQSVDAAKKEINRENYFRARQILHSLKAQPGVNVGEVYYYLGNAYLLSEDADSARIFYAESVKINPKNITGYLAAGRLAVLSKNYADAKAQFERAFQTSRYKSAWVFLEAGEAWYRPEITDLKEAIVQLEEAYKLDGKNVAVLLSLGDAYLLQKDNTQAAGMALSKYEAAAEVDKTNGEAYLKIARINRSGKIYDEAIKNYEKCVELDPANAIAYKELGETYYWNRSYDKMIACFKKYNELTPDDIESKTRLAAFYFGNKEYEKCLEECGRGLTAEPNNFYFLRMSAYSLFELKRYKEGYESVKKFWSVPNVKIKPNDYYYSARLATENGDTTNAFAYYKKALEKDSANCDLLSGYAKTLYRAKRYQEAVTTLQSKQQYNCTFITIDYFDLGRAQYFAGDYAGAEKSLAEFTTRTPTTPDGHYWRAKANLRMETETQTGLALPHYEKYISLTASDPVKFKKNLIEAYNYLGANFSGNGDKVKGKEYFQKVLELDPADPIALELIKGL